MRHLSVALVLIAMTGAAQAATWSLDSHVDYPIFTGDQSGLRRTQGLAWNAEAGEWIGSWQYGLQRARADFTPLQGTGSIDLATGAILSGIPKALADQGFDHIGDIDVQGGVIYASLDSAADGYNKGHVALFDASDLSYKGVLRPLIGAPDNPRDDVASWVAVDAAAGLGYGKEWAEGDTINIYDLDDWRFSRTLTMDRSLTRIQGGKVVDGTLYLSADDDTRSVYGVDLATGHVDALFQLPSVAGAEHETEGLALRRLADGGLEMFVEMIVDPEGGGRFDAYTRVLRYTSPGATPAPVPAPPALPLLMAALAGLALARRRA